MKYYVMNFLKIAAAIPALLLFRVLTGPNQTFLYPYIVPSIIALIVIIGLYFYLRSRPDGNDENRGS